MKKALLLILLSFCLLFFGFNAQAQIHDFEVDFPQRVIGSGEHTGSIILLNSAGNELTKFNDSLQFIIKKTSQTIYFNDGRGEFITNLQESGLLNIEAPQQQILKQVEVKVLPFWLSILPPLIAIALALILKEVIISLFVGVFSGVLILQGFTFSDWINSLLRLIDTYIINVVADADHMAIIVFSMLIGAMVSLVNISGGMDGVVAILKKFASSARRTQLVTWLLGILIFFDDYANTLIVGNTMRPLTDRYRISREKLAYIVDSTAAPIAAIAFITTWIGAELGYIKDATITLGLEESAYSIFLNSLKYAFYPILAIFFIFMLIVTRRDFGSMLRYERLAEKGELDYSGVQTAAPEQDSESKEKLPSWIWINALLPILTLVVVTFASLIYTGSQSTVFEGEEPGFWVKLSTIIGNADSYKALLWASMVSLLVAFILTTITRKIKVEKAVEAAVDGFKTMLFAILILILAWTLADLTKEMRTAAFLSDVFISMNFSPYLLPAAVFVLSGLMAFSTGSSWGTMAILYPLMLPLTYNLGIDSGLSFEETKEIIYHVTSVVLAGAVFGDHCSPISDTTILSSLASSCNHITHVRTQLPYALIVAAVSVLGGHLLIVFVPQLWFLVYPLGLLILFLIIRYAGKLK